MSVLVVLICVVSGVLLCLAGGFTLSEIGAVVGIGTIITAFFMGPLIDYFNIHLARKILGS
ncbi:MAG: hypothetical protein IJT16_15250 [Lachnospiraceae bacterium]|nr:hypothetical protein [Lachnospiraceae bacterium]